MKSSKRYCDQTKNVLLIIKRKKRKKRTKQNKTMQYQLRQHQQKNQKKTIVHTSIQYSQNLLLHLIDKNVTKQMTQQI